MEQEVDVVSAILSAQQNAIEGVECSNDLLGQMTRGPVDVLRKSGTRTKISNSDMDALDEGKTALLNALKDIQKAEDKMLRQKVEQDEREHRRQEIQNPQDDDTGAVDGARDGAGDGAVALIALSQKRRRRGDTKHIAKTILRIPSGCPLPGNWKVQRELRPIAVKGGKGGTKWHADLYIYAPNHKTRMRSWPTVFRHISSRI